MTGEAVDLLQRWKLDMVGKIEEGRYAFDDEDLRPYFPSNPFSRYVRLVSKVFGLRIEERPTQFGEKILPEKTGVLPRSVWHEEVRFYDLFDNQNDRLLGSFYADWHPRSTKRAGAWMNFLKTGEPDENNDREPHLGLICGNLTAATESKPALLTHYEVETVFHEFGHLLHHLCGEVPHRSLNGVM